MAKTIWKYQIPFGRGSVNFELELPKGATCRAVREMPGGRDEACMWFEVDAEAPKEKRQFEIVGTGNPIGHKIGTHLGSVFMGDLPFVFHIYEVIMP